MNHHQVSDVLAQAFAAEGTDSLFTLMGDANMYWSAAMADNQKTRLVHARHEQVAEDGLGQMLAREIDPELAIGGFKNPPALVAKEETQHLPQVGVVVDDENSFHPGQMPIVSAPRTEPTTCRAAKVRPAESGRGQG